MSDQEPATDGDASARAPLPSLPPGLAERLRTARSIVALTGAGVSAESGLATFREPGGLWDAFDPDEVATPRAFRRDPAKVWAWYTQRRLAMREARPNAAHAALAELERRVPDFTLLTQNIDGLHAAAGSRRLIELHGSIHRARCSADGSRFDQWQDAPVPPPCPDCGKPLRPDVVWFGESLPIELLDTAWRAARRAEVFLSIGTSGLVEPAASLPLVAAEGGALVVEINPEATPLSRQADFVLPGRAGLWLPALLAGWPPAAAGRSATKRDGRATRGRTGA